MQPWCPAQQQPSPSTKYLPTPRNPGISTPSKSLTSPPTTPLQNPSPSAPILPRHEPSPVGACAAAQPAVASHAYSNHHTCFLPPCCRCPTSHSIIPPAPPLRWACAQQQSQCYEQSHLAHTNQPHPFPPFPSLLPSNPLSHTPPPVSPVGVCAAAPPA